MKIGKYTTRIFRWSKKRKKVVKNKLNYRESIHRSPDGRDGKKAKPPVLWLGGGKLTASLRSLSQNIRAKPRISEC